MESSTVAPLLLLTVFLLGLVHGFDWDHIAAISDITGTVPERRRGFWLATMYVLGHALVVSLLGIVAISIGLALPDWVDNLMERVVGLTLIFLAAWLIYSLFQSGDQFQIRSRWMLIIDGLRATAAWVVNLLRGQPQPFEFQAISAYGTGTAFGIEMLHGIGAETATQALLFLGVAGTGGKLLGTLMLLAFVIGLIISNSAITLASLFGFQAASRSNKALRVVGVFVAVFSLGLGIFFVAGQGTLLPTIIGWEPVF